MQKEFDSSKIDLSKVDVSKISEKDKNWLSILRLFFMGNCETETLKEIVERHKSRDNKEENNKE